MLRWIWAPIVAACSLPSQRAAGFMWWTVFPNPCNLGAGLERTGRLSRGSMGRTVQALQDLPAEAEETQGAPDAAGRHRSLPPGPECARWVHPSSVRRETGLRAGNHPPRGRGPAGGDFLRAACVSTQAQSNCLVVDIGGGSTELVWIDICLGSANARPAPSAIMRLRSGFATWQTAPLPAAQAWWTGSLSPSGVATLRDQFRDVEDDAARFRPDELVFRRKPGRFRTLSRICTARRPVPDRRHFGHGDNRCGFASGAEAAMTAPRWTDCA